LARWCAGQPAFAQVLHPALPTSPGHAYWKKVCGTAIAAGRGAAAGLWTVIVDERYPRTQVDAFCDALRLFKIGYSWGGPISLVVPYDLNGMRGHRPAYLARGELLRFAAGLEDTDDLRADLAQALAAAGLTD
jgi:cystathionine beta-lyase